MTLSMIELTPDIASLTRWAERERLLANRSVSDFGYAMHAALTSAFGAEMTPKPFSIREAPGRALRLLGYSTSDPGKMKDQAAALADPEVYTSLRISEMASKQMPSRWVRGAEFGFEVRVRPMIRTDKDGDRSKSREVDAFLRSPPNSNRGEVYSLWLRDQMERGGATLVSTSMSRFSLTPVTRRAKVEGGRPLKVQSGPDAVLMGTLQIQDGDLFSAFMSRGVGRHRAFGFGMLLLRPRGC